MLRRPALVILIAVLAPIASAAPKRVKAPLVRPSAAQQKLIDAARESRAKAAEVERQIGALRAQLVRMAQEEAASERAAADKKAKLAALNGQEAQLQTDIGRDRAAAARLMGALELYRRNPPPALLVHPSSAEDAARAQILARAMAPELAARSRSLADRTEEVRRVRREAEAASDDLFRTESTLADQRTKIETVIADKTALERGLMGEADKSQAQLKVLAAQSAGPAALIGKLPQSAPEGAAPTGFRAPVQGRLVTRFGQAAAAGGRSQGYSWKASPRAEVVAPASGVVQYAGPLKGWGEVIILKTGGGYDLVLAGLETTSAVSGRKIVVGEPVGRMGDGADGGADLYLEVRRGGAPVDPARWLKTGGH